MNGIEKVRELFNSVEKDLNSDKRKKALNFIKSYVADVQDIYFERNSSEKDVDAVAYKAIGAIWAYENLELITWDEAIYLQNAVNDASYGRDVDLSGVFA